MLKLLLCINKVNHSFITTFVYPLPPLKKMLPPVSKFQSRLSRARLSKTFEVGWGGGINKVYYRQFQEMGVRVAEQFFFMIFLI